MQTRSCPYVVSKVKPAHHKKHGTTSTSDFIYKLTESKFQPPTGKKKKEKKTPQSSEKTDHKKKKKEIREREREGYQKREREKEEAKSSLCCWISQPWSPFFSFFTFSICLVSILLQISTPLLTLFIYLKPVDLILRCKKEEKKNEQEPCIFIS